MKTIGIDARLYFQTGVGVYLRNFLHYLQGMNLPNVRFFVYVMEEDASRITLHTSRFTLRPVKAQWHSFSEQTSFVRTLKKDNLDLMHFTYFSYPVLYKKPFIATVHDVTPLIFKTGKASTKNRLLFEIKHKAFNYVLASQVKHAQVVITPTQTVKKQLIQLFGNNYADKIKPIYEGINYELVEGKENTALAKNFKKPFFIYIGNSYPHKNVERLVEAFAKVKEDVELLIVGPHNFFSKRIESLVEKLGQSERIRFVYQAATADLIYFYKHAEALINPSLSEGFGLPMVEATYFGLPVIASDIEVFHELLGDSYTSFDQYDVTDMTAKMSHFLTSKQKKEHKNLPEYSFEKMTKEIVEIYKRMKVRN